MRTGADCQPCKAGGGLVERYSYSLFSPPDDMAGSLELIAGHKKREAVGDEQRGHDFERRPCLGQVPNSAVNSTAAELNRPGLQHAATRSNPVFAHAGTKGRISETGCTPNSRTCPTAATPPTRKNAKSAHHIRAMEIGCPKCSTIVNSTRPARAGLAEPGGVEWKDVNVGRLRTTISCKRSIWLADITYIEGPLQQNTSPFHHRLIVEIEIKSSLTLSIFLGEDQDSARAILARGKESC